MNRLLYEVKLLVSEIIVSKYMSPFFNVPASEPGHEHGHGHEHELSANKSMFPIFPCPLCSYLPDVCLDQCLFNIGLTRSVNKL